MFGLWALLCGLGLGFRASGFGLGARELFGPPWVHPFWALEAVLARVLNVAV